VIFDVSPLELITLAFVAVFIFGPDRFPKMIVEATKFLRKIRELSDNAKQDIRKELGPEFDAFEFEDLNPQAFVRKQLATHDDYVLKEIDDLRQDIAADAREAVAPTRFTRSPHGV
jgi:sec-independent protein translocase protein TatB